MKNAEKKPSAFNPTPLLDYLYQIELLLSYILGHLNESLFRTGTGASPLPSYFLLCGAAYDANTCSITSSMGGS